MTFLTPVADVPSAKPSAPPIDVPWLWLIALAVLVGVAGYCWAAHGNTYDDRLSWNYGVAAIASGVLAVVTFAIALSEVLG